MPAHAVVAREDVRDDVVSILDAAQVSSLQFCVDVPVDLIFPLSQILHFIFCDVETITGRKCHVKLRSCSRFIYLYLKQHLLCY